MADAEAASAQQLSVEAARVDHGADVAYGQEIDQRRLAGFDIDLDFCKTCHE